MRDPGPARGGGLHHRRFEARFGGTLCHGIQQNRFGRTFDSFRDEDREAWYEAGDLEVCPGVCAEAARITADVLLRVAPDTEDGGPLEP